VQGTLLSRARVSIEVPQGKTKTVRLRQLPRGAVDSKMSFKVEIPEASEYYLVLDNRRGAGPVKATATIRAERGAASPSRPPPAKGGKLNEARAGAAPAA